VREESAIPGVSIEDLADVGDEAFYTSSEFGDVVTNTVTARQGSVVLIVGAPCPLEEVTDLVRHVSAQLARRWGPYGPSRRERAQRRDAVGEVPRVRMRPSPGEARPQKPHAVDHPLRADLRRDVQRLVADPQPVIDLAVVDQQPREGGEIEGAGPREGLITHGRAERESLDRLGAVRRRWVG